MLKKENPIETLDVVETSTAFKRFY